MHPDVSQIRVFKCFSYDWRRLISHHTCFHVSAVVATSFAAVGRHGYFLHAGGLLAGSYVKTRVPSDQGGMAPV